MRSLAYIEKIKALKPIPNADNIECAEVLGWELVVRKGDFKINDQIIYVETDAILPDLPPFEFLRSKKFRIKIVKLRGQVSMGIIFPLSILKEIDPSFDLASIKLGQDVTEALQIVKYDPELESDVASVQEKKSWIANKWSFVKWKLFRIKPVKRGNDFPSDVPKTDETRVQKMASQLERRAGEPAYITEKCEGSSATFVYRRNKNWLSNFFGNYYTFEVCSRNRIVYSSETRGDTSHYLFLLAMSLDIVNSFKKLNRSLAVQGESLGPKVQGNIYKLPGHELRVFSIYDLDSQTYLSYNELVAVVKELGLTMVPVLDANASIVNDVKYYVELSKGKSQINTSVLREGIVIRTLDGTFSFKSINPVYLLKQE